MKVLVVEDEIDLADAVGVALNRHGFAVDVVYDGEAADALLFVNDYDAVVLDRDLPSVHGDALASTIISQGHGTKILMLTAARRLEDKLSGFALGADDYLVKPFDVPELVARLRALERRPADARPTVLRHGDVSLDTFRREVSRAGHFVHLSKKEFSVLQLIMQADGGVVSAERLLEKAWDENANPFSNTVRVTLSSLRKKLGAPEIIVTVSGVGYKMAASDAGAAR